MKFNKFKTVIFIGFLAIVGVIIMKKMRGLNLVPYFRRDAKIEVQPLIAFSNLIDNVNVMN